MNSRFLAVLNSKNSRILAVFSSRNSRIPRFIIQLFLSPGLAQQQLADQ